MPLWNSDSIRMQAGSTSHLCENCLTDCIVGILPLAAMIRCMIVMARWVWRCGLAKRWCVPWASILHSRMDNGDAAVLLLEIWQCVIINLGHGTLHDTNFAGLSIMPSQKQRTEVIQLDAGFGAVTAIQQMLLHSRHDVIHVYAGVPASWKQCCFRPIPTVYGVKVGARIKQGQLVEVVLEAMRDIEFKLANPWREDCHCEDEFNDIHVLSGDILTLRMNNDQRFILSLTSY